MLMCLKNICRQNPGWFTCPALLIFTCFCLISLVPSQAFVAINSYCCEGYKIYCRQEGLDLDDHHHPPVSG